MFPFEPQELATVLSHYDAGVIESIQTFPRGSRKAPKLVLKTDVGLYLLKRRAPGKDDPFKVAFCHAMQLHLAQRQFPLPRLIGTRRQNNSMLQHESRIYELFEFIHGVDYDRSPQAATDAGKTLGLFHKLLRDFDPPYEPPGGSYHGAKQVSAALERIPDAIGQAGRNLEEPRHKHVRQVARCLRDWYGQAFEAVNQLGFEDWPRQIIHSDWHPGNMLFRGPRVVAVIDYDSARLQPRIMDIANGALQFSLLGGGDEPGEWPEGIDLERFRAFLHGYDTVPECVISRAELRAAPHLMIEALIAEAAIPLGATGRFNQYEGGAFLGMIQRKVRWILDHAQALVNLVDGESY